jgi:cell division protein FtsL
MSRGRSALPWIFAVLWCALLLSAAAAIYSKYRSRALFVQLERLDGVRDRIDAEWGRLQLEQSAWSSYPFVERVASERLHMAAPDPHEIAIITPALSAAEALASNGAPPRAPGARSTGVSSP